MIITFISYLQFSRLKERKQETTKEEKKTRTARKKKGEKTHIARPAKGKHSPRYKYDSPPPSMSFLLYLLRLQF
jgi:hypothetical protein